MNNNTFQWILSAAGRNKIYIVLLALTRGLCGLLGVLYALGLKKAVDAAALQNGSGFFRGICFLVILTASILALRALMRGLSEFTRASLENTLKLRLTDVILHKDCLAVSAVHSGEWMNRLTNDTAVVSNGCVEIIPGLSEMLVKLCGASVMIIALEPRSALILIPGGILMIFSSGLFRSRMKKYHREVQEKDGELRVFLQERIGSLLMIRSFAAEEQTVRDAAGHMKEHREARMRKNRFSNLCNTGFGAVMNGMYLLGAGWCGYGILTGRLSFGTMTAVTHLIAQIQTPFASLTGYLPRIYSVLASAERLMEAEAFPEDGDQPALSLQEVRDFYRERFSSLGMEGVSFTYRQDTGPDTSPAVKNVSFELKKGESAALTGQSGCGKTTALKLLMTLYRPDSGECFIREKDGNRFSPGMEWRRLFAFVPQGNFLMSGTIREIVTMSDPEPGPGTEERLKEALRAACAEEFVSRLEKGADTLLGERGTGLSEGQMQRISIARAVFSGSPVLLLDEATSALDETTEEQLLRNLKRMTDRTVLIVTHRPRALSFCDRKFLFTEDGMQ